MTTTLPKVALTTVLLTIFNATLLVFCAERQLWYGVAFNAIGLFMSLANYVAIVWKIYNA